MGWGVIKAVNATRTIAYSSRVTALPSDDCRPFVCCIFLGVDYVPSAFTYVVQIFIDRVRKYVGPPDVIPVVKPDSE